MGKIGFVYPGQGSQHPGMGQALLQAHPELFERYLEPCDHLAGAPISQLCVTGSAAALSQTQIAQPALFAYSLALTAYAQSLGLFPDLVAGHSLGEYTAAVAAGSLAFHPGLALVARRGRLMQHQQEAQPGAMAAVLGLAQAPLEDLCHDVSRQALVLLTNCNAPGQWVVSGTEQGVQDLLARIRASGVGKALRLPVSGAFHSPLMQPVQTDLQAYTRTLTWHEPRIPLVANVSGAVLTRGSAIRQELVAQITRPVQWVRCVEQLVAQGCETLIELGPGQVLSKLVQQIAPQVHAVALPTPAHIAAFLHAHPALRRPVPDRAGAGRGP